MSTHVRSSMLWWMNGMDLGQNPSTFNRIIAIICIGKVVSDLFFLYCLRYLNEILTDMFHFKSFIL